MGANNSRVNEQVLPISVAGQRLMEVLEDAVPTPPCEAFIDSVPGAVLSWQQSPLCAATSDPQDGFEKEPAILLSSDVSVRM